MAFLERSTQLAQLHDHLDDVASGSGRLILVGGEAGVGKSTLVDTFSRETADRAKVLIGACDPLSTPRPLSPLYDMLDELGTPVETALGKGDNLSSLFPLVLRGISDTSQPTLMVIEDAHWADDATLDLLRYLGRRIDRVRAMLLITYRDDEAGPRHPLRLALGDVASSQSTRRISLPALSRRSVQELASGSDVDPEILYQRTGGNPFFVTEVLATASHHVPATVTDAVLARAARLGPSARSTLEVVAVLGPRAEMPLILEMAECSSGQAITALDEGIHAGLLQAEGEVVMFRHELAREAILDTMFVPSRAALHARALQVLRRTENPSADPARLAHHAEAAGDAPATLEYALAAAEGAVALSAHREALAQYNRALRAANVLPDLERAEILERAAFEAYLGDELETAIDMRRQAIQVRRALGDMLAVGRNLTHLTRALSTSGRATEARATVHEAIGSLESLAPGPELALAYSYLSQLLMLAGENKQAIAHGRHAIELAERFDAPLALLHALNNVGMARVKTGDHAGFSDIERSLDLALRHEMDDDVARAYVNLSGAAIRKFDFETTLHYASEGIDFCTERDLMEYLAFLLSRLAHVQLYRGAWSEAVETCHLAIRARGTALGIGPAHTILQLTRSRRGDADAHEALTKTYTASNDVGHAAFTGLLHAAHAESAWLTGETEGVIEHLREAIEDYITLGERDLYAPLASWLRIIGGPESVPADLPRLRPPYSLMVAGEWLQASEAWEALGCPYESALCLLLANDEPSLRRALALFEDLGAHPAALKATRRLQAIGARSIARGPRKSTRATPGHLTARELEVFQLLADGLSNNDIAERLFLSPNTVGHHVSAILAKLDARSRSEAVAIGTRMGLDHHSSHS